MFGFDQNDVILFVLIFARITTAFILFPIFGSNSIPSYGKIGACLFLTVLVFPLLENYQLDLFPSTSIIILSIAQEVLVGVIMGFVTVFLFASIEMAGQILSMQIGFGIVQVYSPESQGQVSIISQYKYLFAAMVFFILDGHLFLIEGLAKSFQTVPPLTAHFSKTLYTFNMQMASELFVASVKIGAPIIVALLLTSVALGLMARAVPQMNVFFVGMPLKISIGLLALAFSMPIFLYFFRKLVIEFKHDFLTIIKLLGS